MRPSLPHQPSPVREAPSPSLGPVSCLRPIATALHPRRGPHVSLGTGWAAGCSCSELQQRAPQGSVGAAVRLCTGSVVRCKRLRRVHSHSAVPQLRRGYAAVTLRLRRSRCLSSNAHAENVVLAISN